MLIQRFTAARASMVESLRMGIVRGVVANAGCTAPRALVGLRFKLGKVCNGDGESHFM